MPPHDAAAESYLKKSHPRACPRSLIAGDRLVLGLRAVSLTSVTCAWRGGLVKVRASWPRPEVKIQMPRSDTADVQGWDLLVAGDLVRGEA
jgi:hypothetical protein